MPGNEFVPFHWDKDPKSVAALEAAQKEFDKEQAEE